MKEKNSINSFNIRLKNIEVREKKSFCWWSFFIPAALSCVIHTSLIQVRNCEINRINLIALDWKLFLKTRKFICLTVNLIKPHRNMRLLVCVTEQNYVSIFFTRLWSVRNSIYYLGTKVDWWLTIKNVILFSIHFYLSFGFVFMRMRRWNPEILWFCVPEIKPLLHQLLEIQSLNYLMY